MSLSTLWKKFMDGLVTDIPPELDDERHYGRRADYVARKEGWHPALPCGVIRRLEQWGRCPADPGAMHRAVRDYVNALSPAAQLAILNENLVIHAPRPRSLS